MYELAPHLNTTRLATTDPRQRRRTLVQHPGSLLDGMIVTSLKPGVAESQDFCLPGCSGLGCADCRGNCKGGMGDLWDAPWNDASILGDFSLQTVWIMAGVGVLLYKAFFSDNAKGRRQALRQETVKARQRRAQIRREYGYV